MVTVPTITMSGAPVSSNDPKSVVVGPAVLPGLHIQRFANPDREDQSL